MCCVIVVFGFEPLVNVARILTLPTRSSWPFAPYDSEASSRVEIDLGTELYPAHGRVSDVLGLMTEIKAGAI